MKRKYKMLSEEDFNNIKVLINAGVRTKHIMSITGRSPSVISLIKKSESLEDYKRINSNYRQSKTVVVEELKNDTDRVEVSFQPSITVILGNINESLINIDKRLKWLEENTAVPKSRRFW